MLQYAIQVAGRDFEPIGDWSTDPQAALLAVQMSADYDLLVWDPSGDRCEIYAQKTLAGLADRLERTAYAKLLARMTSTYTAHGYVVTPQLRSRWYLVADLAALEHQSLLNTAAALLSLTIQYLKADNDLIQTGTQLRGLADQARCWLLAAKVSPLQLVATEKPLRTLLDYLLAQAVPLDACHAGGRSKAWELANDALVLSRPVIRPEQFQTVNAWKLIRAAALEQRD